MDRRSYLQSLAVGAAALAGCTTFADRGTTPEPEEEPTVRIETTTMELEVPWGAAYGPDDALYVTERPGRIKQVEPNGDETVADFTDAIAHTGEGGLLGLAFHPDDETVAYTYQTYRAADGLTNRVVRHRADRGFAADEVVVDDIPGGSVHDGGRLAVGPDDALYVTTGDAGRESAAQSTDSLAGKVLRLTLDGEPHPDNPFDDYVFTYGHRNPQGLAFRDGTLYGTEHGPDNDDEINVLRAGRNYGWPEVTGVDESGYADPIATYTPTIAPAGAAFYDGPIEDWRGDLFFGTLAGRHLHRVGIDETDNVTHQQRYLVSQYGRLRTVFTGPNDHLYVTTSNRDGRGEPAPQDDRVLSIRPA